MSEQQLASNVSELFDLVQKSQGIISTHAASDIEESAESVEDKYRRYAETHISLGDTSGFEDRVKESVTTEETPTMGYLYGPFGYGKTSTSVSVWKTLHENNIVAVPPFSFTSFSAVMRATYGWLRHILETQSVPEYVDELEEIRESYLQEQLEEYARDKEDEYDLPFDQLVEMFEQMEQENDLDLSINADTLIDFFSECTELALEADFDGLVVMGDELQQYFKSADNRQDAESRFRDLVFELYSGAKIQDEFGFFVSMPAQTKSNLDSQAGDVLNRLESDNLTLNLETVYGQKFPAELWNRYASNFNFEDQQYDVISKHALTAIGQICSRQDLSNGPRTVIDIFRIALQQYHESSTQFTALDLAEAFYEDDVRYQGNSTIIQAAIGDALDHSAVNTEAKRTFIKLCAVFPEEGIPEEVVDEYDLEDVRRALSKKLHGELIKVIAEGYTLIEVTRTEGPQDIVRELIHDFWGQYDTDHVNARYALEALANKLVCGELFESMRGELRGWATGDGLKEIDRLTYQKHRIEGTFNIQYPKRVASIGVADTEHEDEIVGRASLGPSPNMGDIAFNFVLGWEQSGDGRVDPHIRRDSTHEYTFVLDGRETFDKLPDGIEFLRDAMDPNAVNPFLMLALVQFLEEDDTELDAQQQNRVESFQQSLLDQTLRTLFDDELIQSAPFEIRRAGKQSVEQVFTSAMQELYPDYHPIIASSKFDQMMRDYLDFLESLRTKSLRRGNDTLKETKSDVASRFNLGSTSSYSGRVKKHYSDLLTVVNDSANNYEVRAELHPFEQEIVDELESGEREEIPLEEVQQRGIEKGYLPGELDFLFEFLSRRKIVRPNENEALELSDTQFTIEQVKEKISECRRLLDTIEELDEEQIPEGTTTDIIEIESVLEETNKEDGEQLEALYVHAEDIVDRLEQQGKMLHSRYEQACSDLKNQLERETRQVVPDHLDETIEGGVQFVGGLNDSRTQLEADFRDLKNDLNGFIETLETDLDAYSEANVDNAEALKNTHSEVESQREQIEEEREELVEKAEKLKDWKRFTQQVAATKEDISGYAQTFDESVEEETEIENFIARVSERFADNPIAALGNLEGFEQELERIEEKYRSRQKDREEAFQDNRETFKSILQEATDGNATGLRRAQFNIRNPEESRRNLLEEFKEAYDSQVLDQAETYLEDARREIAYAQIVGKDEVSDVDPDDVEERIDTAEATLRDLRSTLNRFSFNNIGDETPLSSQGQELLSNAEGLNKDAMKFRQGKTPDDEEITETLDRIETHRSVDFKDLLMEYHDDGEGLEPEELLDRIQRLFVLNQIDIKIAQRRR